jgi:hypothetical protein
MITPPNTMRGRLQGGEDASILRRRRVWLSMKDPCSESAAKLHAGWFTKTVAGQQQGVAKEAPVPPAEPHASGSRLRLEDSREWLHDSHPTPPLRVRRRAVVTPAQVPVAYNRFMRLRHAARACLLAVIPMAPPAVRAAQAPMVTARRRQRPPHPFSRITGPDRPVQTWYRVGSRNGSRERPACAFPGAHDVQGHPVPRQGSSQ